MHRREIVALIGGVALARPSSALAQLFDRTRRVGFIMGLAEGDPEAKNRVRVFQQGLADLGWTEGRNIRIEYRYAASDANRAQAFAKELVALAPDLIIAHSTPVTAALMRETQTIPIVFIGVADPIGSGFIATAVRPGGNVTGFSNIEPAIGGKWVELLKEIAPGATRLAFIFNPTTAAGGGTYFWRSVEATVPSFSMKATPALVQGVADIERTFAEIAREGGGAIVSPDIFNTVNRAAIIAHAAQYRVPVVYPYRYYAIDGGLVAYGIENIDMFRRAPAYVDRILKGARPADLPVQSPVKYEFVLNLKTAKAIGIDVPAQLVARANEVVE